jgi:type IV secretory pathway protease TraF
VLGPGEFCLQSTYFNWSFDGRCIGPVRRQQIIDRRVSVIVRIR